jgi:hypothetical protein
MVLIFAPNNTDQASRKISSRGLVFELIKPFMIPLSETSEGFFIYEDYQNNLTTFKPISGSVRRYTSRQLLIE